VRAAARLDDDDIERAYIAAVANNEWRNYLIENPLKKD